MPRDVTHGSSSNTLFLSTDFQLQTQYADVSSILKDAFARLLTLINLPHAQNMSIPHASSLLLGLNVVVSSTDEHLQYGVDESYNLSIPLPELRKPVYAYLQVS